LHVQLAVGLTITVFANLKLMLALVSKTPRMRSKLVLARLVLTLLVGKLPTVVS